ncbi:tetratricopeptide repeat protein [Phenylobacterium sp.]|uniref:tetratricopeptide repeat protein n=1 Tax=Phenylobacterium sp. TaxID=1871053 RepID=UPI003565DAF9
MTGKSVFLAVSALALATVASPVWAADCKLEKVAELPVRMQNGRPTVAAKINGRDATFAVASGDFYSMVSTDAAARFGMKPSLAPFGLRVSGIGGADAEAKVAKADSFEFLGNNFRNQEFLVGPRAGGPLAAGAIGQNFLGALDVEYDLANGVIRFFKTEKCGSANLAYWSEGKTVSRIPIENPTPALSTVIARARVDGHSIRVKFSSATTFSYLSTPAAARAGIRPSSEGVLAAGLIYGLGGKGLETSISPFESFAIGDEEIKNTRLRVTDLDMANTDMLLGTDFFLSHRILVSKSQRKIYFTYNGGPVFKLDQAGAQQVQAQPAPVTVATATPPAASTEGAPTTAADFSRQGSALAARRDFPAAIADFTKAIELEPNEARHYHDRALAHLGARQPVLAMADLDQALKAQPDDVQSLMTRGELLIQRHDLTRAQADFDTAIKLAPENHNLPLRAGSAYTRSGNFEQGIREYDSWLAAHPKDVDAAQVLNARCFTRAAWGKELETALADCDAAVKRGGKTSVVLDNRGLVLLRLGRVDEAIKQYDAAIRAQPKAAWALYGRGLAKLQKGDKTGGDADIQAATAIAPNLPQEAKRYGLAAGDAPAAAAPTAG